MRDFPSVRLERVGSDLVVPGSVSSEDDLALIERMAESTGAESFVRYVPPEVPAGRGTTAGVRRNRRGSDSPQPPRDAVDIEYDVQVMEASVAFGSSSYETGIEPSGRVLHAVKVRARLGAEAQTFIPGKSLDSKDIKIPPKELATSGIRLTLTPATLEERTVEHAQSSSRRICR